MVQQRADTGFTGDRQLTDDWAKLLGLRSWYEWRPMNELPEDARHIWEEGPA
jgi:hypothetical protein